MRRGMVLLVKDMHAGQSTQPPLLVYLIIHIHKHTCLSPLPWSTRHRQLRKTHPQAKGYLNQHQPDIS
ncbi:hypothetical protein SCLCIDRAFT_1223334, partial [Scleroderma citrinum Foug A]